jgi:ABC-type polysaccharide/polyol phosphate transport system ATPase subunit
VTPVICVENAGVHYKLRLEKKSTLRRNFIKIFQRNGHQEFWALRHLDFQVSPGEVLGVIGTNGSGKSTLLKLLAGILIADEGFVTTQGRISTLLQLGAGFEPELSGRENIYLNGLVLGLSKQEIERRFENIVDFAQLGKFIDAPLKTYSSGMQARLGFSVACSVDPDILLVDEILSVGDETFREKSYARMLDFRQQGKTILLVSHNLDKITSFCSRTIWLNNGQLMDDGATEPVVNKYRSFAKKRR